MLHKWERDPLDGSKLKVPIFIVVAFWILAIVMWKSSGNLFFLLNFAYIGTSVGLGMGIYSLLPRQKKPWGRRLALFLVGGYMLGILGLMARENMQIEGFFYLLLAGVFAGAVIHYFVAKICEPVLFGRAWCGWACWTAMVLDLLPFTKSSGRLPAKYGYIRYVHFAISLTLILVLWFAYNYRIDNWGKTSLYWLITGNLFYYAAGIGMAFYLKDNRAFCKYLCHITVLLKTTSRFSLLKVAGNPDQCTNCGVCTKACPMDIMIPSYITNGQRILSTECIFCQTCVNVCPHQTLTVSFGFDLGGKDLLISSPGHLPGSFHHN